MVAHRESISDNDEGFSSLVDSIGHLNRRTALAGLAIGGLAAPAMGAATNVKLDTPEERLNVFLRATGDISGRQSLTWASGSVFAWMLHLGGHHLFDFNLFGVQRLKKTETGWLRLGKEAGIYTDKNTGKALERWNNPFTEKSVDVLHLKNNPSSGEFTSAPDMATMPGQVCFTRNVLSTKPSVMPVDEYPLYS